MTLTEDPSAEHQMQRVKMARTRLVGDSPEFGGPSLHLTLRADPSIPSMQTDGTYLDFNPEWTAQWRLTQLMGLTAHETYHCLRGDPFRMGDRDPEVWNDAVDVTAQGHLRAANFDLPPNKMDDRIPEFRGMSNEEAYAILLREKKQGGEQGQQPNSGTGAYPIIVPAPPESVAEGGEPASEKKRLTAEDWRILGAQSQMLGKKRGTMPGSMVEDLEQSRQVAPDWISELQEFVTNTIATTVSWLHPNRRYVWQNLYLPGPLKENMPRILMVIDSSGSMSMTDIADCCYQVEVIANDLMPEAIDVLIVDAEIQRVYSFEPGDHIEIEVAGRGGTAFTPAFEWLKDRQEEGTDYACMIYLTDLDGDHPTEPELPVLWATPQHVTKMPLFGRVIRIPPSD